MAKQAAGIKANGGKLNILQSSTRSMIGLFQQLGMMFLGNRNMYQVFGYSNTITCNQMLARYRRQDIASRLINTPANALWTDPPVIDGSETVTALVEDLADRLMLWQVFNRADKLAGMGAYSTILIGLSDGQQLNQPVRPGAQNKILFLQPYSQESMPVTELEGDLTNPRFGKPKYYNLKPVNSDGRTTSIMGTIVAALGIGVTQIHYSRVIHITENPLEDDVYGVPRMEIYFNLLDDLLKIAGGSAEVYWLNARGGLHIDIDKDMTLDEDSEDGLADEVQDYSDNLTRVLRTRGTKVTPINMQQADPRMAFYVTLALLAAASNIPQRILMGAEAGQLASAQDRANWASYVDERRASFGIPSILRPFLLRMVDIGLISITDAISAVANWPEAFKLNPLERSQTSAQQARAAANLTKAMTTVIGILDAEEARNIIAGKAPQDTLKDAVPQITIPTPVAPNSPSGSKKNSDPEKGPPPGNANTTAGDQ